MGGQAQRWDVFCRVVDNYGDAAVCWRLARQLVEEHGLRVRLWCDALGALHGLNPDIAANVAPGGAQHVDGVEIRSLQELEGAGADAVIDGAAEVAIEAFGCGLPERYQQAMAHRLPAALWITLEYLSAEPWVGTHHGLPSPHPSLPLQRYYFFPGFDEGTGGLLRERGLLEKRQALQRDGAARARFWQALGFPPPAQHALTVSLFGYENAAVAPLLDAWAAGTQPVIAAVPASRLRPEVVDFFGAERVLEGGSLACGSLEARFIPFLPQPRYDELLWLCDWNFVRGEDSFVRAQWAGRPMVWQIYPQAEGAHWPKLNAFFDRYAEGLDAAAAGPLLALWQSWNGGAAAPLAESWAGLAAHQKPLARHSFAWASQLADRPDLTANLVQFCRSKVQ